MVAPINCTAPANGDPCGQCAICRAIARGSDLDVLEIDAATHTGVDNVREVVIEGLAIAPVRNRYKVFIIDEVHMLSGSSFNAWTRLTPVATAGELAKVLPTAGTP